MDTDIIKQMIAALLPVFDQLIADNASTFGKIAWRILRPLLVDQVAIARAVAALPPESRVV